MLTRNTGEPAETVPIVYDRWAFSRVAYSHLEVDSCCQRKMAEHDVCFPAYMSSSAAPMECSRRGDKRILGAPIQVDAAVPPFVLR